MKPRPPLISMLLFAAAGLLLAAAGAYAAEPGDPGGGIRVLDLAATGDGRAYTLAYSADGRLLAVGGAAGVSLYDAQTLAQAQFIPTDTWVRSAAFSPDGRWLATGSYDSSVRLWRVADGALVQAMEGHSGWVRSVAFSPDGLTLVSAGDDNTLRVWRAVDGASLLTITDGAEGVRAVAISPDSQTIAAGGFDNSVRLWRADNGVLLAELPGHTAWVRTLAFSPDGLTLASGGFDTTARLWRVADGLLLHTLQGHTASVLSTVFSPDGTTLATGSVDTTVRLWRVADGVPLSLLSGHGDFVYAVAFAPDGQTLASGSSDNTVRLWTLDEQVFSAQAAAIAAAEPAASSSSCVQCHHPRGDFMEPGAVVLPARVIEVGCETCHTDGARVIKWCPLFPQALAHVGISATAPLATEKLGVPSAAPGLSALIETPGNGEFLYSGGDTVAFVPVAGRVRYPAGQAAQVSLTLEVWSGDSRAAVLTTQSQANGDFWFGLTLNAGQAAVEVAVDLRACLTCHDPDLGNFTPGALLTSELPGGDVRLVLIAESPDGARATDERWIVVDKSQRAAFSVQTITASGAPLHEPGLAVHASTALYRWRGRVFTGATDESGISRFQVEALAQAPTEYVLNVPPTVIDGLLYESVEPVLVTLPTGSTDTVPVRLTVVTRRGLITGSLLEANAPVDIHAISLPAGARASTRASETGVFSFADLPVGRYLVVADEQQLAAQGLAAAAQEVDLATAVEQDMALRAAPLNGVGLTGTVRDAQGNALPFASVILNTQGRGRSATPGSGEFTLFGELGDAVALVASAPGYYSQAAVLDAASGQAQAIDFALVRRPDTRRLDWGGGQVFVPADTVATIVAQDITLESGWLWGEGTGGWPLVIRVGGGVVSLSGGRFALEYLPGQPARFYVFEGSAQAFQPSNPRHAVDLTAGTMLVITANDELVPVPLDAVALQALKAGERESLRPVWQKSPVAIVRDRLALLGINTAQVITFVTYMLVLTSLAVVPLAGVGLWLTRERRKREGTQ